MDTITSPVPDGDRVPLSGYDRWTELINAAANGPTMELPLVQVRRSELIRPYVNRRRIS